MKDGEAEHSMLCQTSMITDSYDLRKEITEAKYKHSAKLGHFVKSTLEILAGLLMDVDERSNVFSLGEFS